MYSIAARDYFVRDQTNEELTVDAMVASGDCFITLATQLDTLTRQHQTTDSNPKLEDLVRTLIYLQRHYAVVKKSANYRQ